MSSPDKAKYLYNIESIIKDIASAHDARILAKESEHANALKEVGNQGKESLKSVDAKFELLL